MRHLKSQLMLMIVALLRGPANKPIRWEYKPSVTNYKVPGIRIGMTVYCNDYREKRFNLCIIVLKTMAERVSEQMDSSVERVLTFLLCVRCQLRC
mmetsp:Transcript_3835/g.7807  ORF Transcript_3835/g.7807 Transcript_3835/m.7807 type:complete len:95 (+) Transcript_3835:1081-1365(+)